MLNTCGPWRQIRLETYEARISDLRTEYKLEDSLDSVSGTITAKVEGQSGKSVAFEVRSGDEVVVKETADVGSEGLAQIQFHVNNPKLWYPHGYGDQPLYTVTATVSTDGLDLHTATRRTGFRRGELVQEPDEIGKTFFFRVNGVDIFCGGSDWIPADSFTPRVTPDKYRKWLEMMVDGYQVMIRYVADARTRVSLEMVILLQTCSWLTGGLGSGGVAFGKRMSSTTCVTSLVSWYGRTSCLGVATIQPGLRCSNLSTRSASPMSADCDTIPPSSSTRAITRIIKCRNSLA